MFVIGKLINDTYIMNNLMVLFKVNLKPYSYVGWAYIIHSCHVCKIQIHLPPSITPFNKSTLLLFIRIEPQKMTRFSSFYPF